MSSPSSPAIDSGSGRSSSLNCQVLVNPGSWSTQNLVNSVGAAPATLLLSRPHPGGLPRWDCAHDHWLALTAPCRQPRVLPPDSPGAPPPFSATRRPSSPTLPIRRRYCWPPVSRSDDLLQHDDRTSARWRDETARSSISSGIASKIIPNLPILRINHEFKGIMVNMGRIHREFRNFQKIF